MYLRSCAGCGRSFRVGDAVTESYFCPKCHSANAAKFAPTTNSIVELLSEPRSRYAVLSVDGDSLTIRPLGAPESPQRQVTVGQLNPAVCR